MQQTKSVTPSTSFRISSWSRISICASSSAKFSAMIASTLLDKLEEQGTSGKVAPLESGGVESVRCPTPISWMPENLGMASIWSRREMMMELTSECNCHHLAISGPRRGSMQVIQLRELTISAASSWMAIHTRRIWILNSLISSSARWIRRYLMVASRQRGSAQGFEWMSLWECCKRSNSAKKL